MDAAKLPVTNKKIKTIVKETNEPVANVIEEFNFSFLKKFLQRKHPHKNTDSKNNNAGIISLFYSQLMNMQDIGQAE